MSNNKNKNKRSIFICFQIWVNFLLDPIRSPRNYFNPVVVIFRFSFMPWAATEAPVSWSYGGLLPSIAGQSPVSAGCSNTGEWVSFFSLSLGYCLQPLPRHRPCSSPVTIAAGSTVVQWVRFWVPSSFLNWSWIPLSSWPKIYFPMMLLS